MQARLLGVWVLPRGRPRCRRCCHAVALFCCGSSAACLLLRRRLRGGHRRRFPTRSQPGRLSCIHVSRRPVHLHHLSGEAGVWRQLAPLEEGITLARQLAVACPQRGRWVDAGYLKRWSAIGRTQRACNEGEGAHGAASARAAGNSTRLGCMRAACMRPALPVAAGPGRASLTRLVAGAQQPCIHGGALPLGGDAAQVVQRGGTAPRGAQRLEHRGVGQDAHRHLRASGAGEGVGPAAAGRRRALSVLAAGACSGEEPCRELARERQACTPSTPATQHRVAACSNVR